jgi:PAS domain-containing protein
MDSELVLAVAVVVAVQIALAFWLRSALASTARGDRPSERPSVPLAAASGGGMREGLRRADDFRSYQAVAAEVAKRQVQVLAEMDTEIQAYERACLAHARRLCELLIAEGRRAGNGGLPESAPNDLESAMQALLAVSASPIDAAAQQRIRKDMEPNATVLLTYAEQTRSQLEEHRFWLGMAMEQELRAYVTGMGRTFAELVPESEALRASEQRYRALMRSHPEASRAIERLSAISVGGVDAGRPA